MLRKILAQVTFFAVLHRIDVDFCEEQRQQCCPLCGGPLHRADYRRKPRGGPAGLPDEYCVRLGLCCGRKECRRRCPPPSCLFSGRAVYWRAVVLLATTMRQQRPRRAKVAELSELFGVTPKTIARWKVYFAEVFPASACWQRVRGNVPPTVANDHLPCDLVEYFIGLHRDDPQAALVACCRLLALGHQGPKEHAR